ncbi:hypothetical protein Pcinc_026809 [Petrolisthes cinctipes]|uniref:Uncharacterized protein n=1 Tax=Petrolisthes cinctipes TaxID=88211 RepID=A0AAE1F565_PETCI|nr:hypothetical protein Pcinc_026809 [Petrolisthes cinctipes]
MLKRTHAHKDKKYSGRDGSSRRDCVEEKEPELRNDLVGVAFFVHHIPGTQFIVPAFFVHHIPGTQFIVPAFFVHHIPGTQFIVPAFYVHHILGTQFIIPAFLLYHIPAACLSSQQPLSTFQTPPFQFQSPCPSSRPLLSTHHKPKRWDSTLPTPSPPPSPIQCD